MTELSKITRDELDELLKEHKLWSELALKYYDHTYKRLHLYSVDLANKDFTGLDLSYCTISNSDLRGAIFKDTDFTKADLYNLNISHLTKQEFFNLIEIKSDFDELVNIQFKDMIYGVPEDFDSSLTMD